MRKMQRLRRTSRPAITLLETILAIALSGIILYYVSMGIHLNLRVLEQQRQEVEQAQLARVLLDQMAQDLRNLAYFRKPAGASGTLAAGGSDATSSGSPRDENGEAAGQGNRSPEDPPGGPPAEPPPENQTEPWLTAGTTLGLVGTSDSLQIDVLRSPRPDQYLPSLLDSQAAAVELPSGVRTVNYFVWGAEPSADGSRDEGSGLFRREVDSQLMRWAVDRADWAQLETRSRNLAPEVVQLRFRYFDGQRWWQSWDSQWYERPPVLVEITLVMEDPQAEVRNTSTARDDTDTADRTYRAVIALPTSGVRLGRSASLRGGS